ncbi:MAG: leucine-rich repeat protein [Bacteroidales bacterium]|nr:leucine-rich repeat protein [Bacteroidales bacterium]
MKPTKLISALMLGVVCAIFASCKPNTEVTVKEAGTLLSQLKDFKSLEDITQLTVKGPLNGNDVSTLRSLKNLSFLDLSQSTLVGDGTYEVVFGKKTENVRAKENEITKKMFAGCAGLKSISLPSNIVAIGMSAFDSCVGLKSIYIPSQVRLIADRAFHGCDSLTGIAVAPDNEIYSSMDSVVYSKDKKRLVIYPTGKKGEYAVPEGVEAIGGGSFRGCKGLTGITFPATLNRIEFFAFQNCTALTSLNVPDAVVSLDFFCFEGCLKLSDIVIGKGVKKIGEGSFWGCQGIKSLSLSEGLTTIGKGAFPMSIFLISLNIPASVKEIGEDAFKNSKTLSEIVCAGSVPPSIAASTFDQVDKTTCKLTVPKGSKGAYMRSTGWNAFKNITEI